MTKAIKQLVKMSGVVVFFMLASGICSASEIAQYPYTDRELFDRGEMRTYEGEHLEAISFPVGGVGSGAIHIDGNGVRHGWMIFPVAWARTNPPGKPAPIMRSRIKGAHERVPLEEPKELASYMAYVPDSFFAVRTVDADGQTAVRVLQTLAEDEFPAMDKLSMQGAYPLAWYKFHDDQLPARIPMRAWNPLIPCDLKDSAIPCAMYDLTAENPTDEPVEVTFLATQQNAAGFVREQPARTGC